MRYYKKKKSNNNTIKSLHSISLFLVVLMIHEIGVIQVGQQPAQLIKMSCISCSRSTVTQLNLFITLIFHQVITVCLVVKGSISKTMFSDNNVVEEFMCNWLLTLSKTLQTQYKKLPILEKVGVLTSVSRNHLHGNHV